MNGCNTVLPSGPKRPPSHSSGPLTWTCTKEQCPPGDRKPPRTRPIVVFQAKWNAIGTRGCRSGGGPGQQKRRPPRWRRCPAEWRRHSCRRETRTRSTPWPPPLPRPGLSAATPTPSAPPRNSPRAPPTSSLAGTGAAGRREAARPDARPAPRRARPLDHRPSAKCPRSAGGRGVRAPKRPLSFRLRPCSPAGTTARRTRRTSTMAGGCGTRWPAQIDLPGRRTSRSTSTRNRRRKSHRHREAPRPEAGGGKALTMSSPGLPDPPAPPPRSRRTSDVPASPLLGRPKAWASPPRWAGGRDEPMRRARPRAADRRRSILTMHPAVRSRRPVPLARAPLQVRLKPEPRLGAMRAMETERCARVPGNARVVRRRASSRAAQEIGEDLKEALPVSTHPKNRWHLEAESL